MAEEPPRESYAINYVCVFIKKPWIRALSIHFVIAAVVAHDRERDKKIASKQVKISVDKLKNFWSKLYQSKPTEKYRNKQERGSFKP